MSFSLNPFAALAGRDDGDVSDSELPRPIKPAQVDAAPARGAVSAASTGRNAAVQKTAAGSNAQSTRRTIPGQTGHRDNRGPRTNNAVPAAGIDADGPTTFDGERGKDDRAAGPGRGAARGGRGGGAGRGDNKERRRGRGGLANQRLDRRSATGRTDSEKQEHQGWGGDEGKREMEAETAGVTDAAAEKKAEGEDAVVEPAPEGEATAATTAVPTENATHAQEPVEPEDNSVTYEEYLKQRKAAGRGALDGLQAPEARQANEGQDEGQWKSGVLVEKAVKEEEDAFFLGSGKEKTAKTKERKQKTLLETEFTTAAPRDPSRPSRGGRGRGESRGTGRGGPGRGRGAGFSSRGARGSGPRPNGQQAVNVDDSSAFPSLS